jgi:hypothetical protein
VPLDAEMFEIICIFPALCGAFPAVFQLLPEQTIEIDDLLHLKSAGIAPVHFFCFDGNLPGAPGCVLMDHEG